MLNRHERRIHAHYEEVADLLDSLAGPVDRVWPGDRWPALVMSNGSNPGSVGGHGFVRYSVESAERGRIVMRFDPRMRLDGTHTFSVEAAGSESIVRHAIDASASSIMKLLWPALIEPLHDALTEDAFDNIEAAVAGRGVTRSTLTGPVRRRRRLMAMLRPAPIPKDAAGSLPRGASVTTAAVLAGLAILHVAWARGSTWPYADAARFVRSVSPWRSARSFPASDAPTLIQPTLPLGDRTRLGFNSARYASGASALARRSSSSCDALVATLETLKTRLDERPARLPSRLRLLRGDLHSLGKLR